MLVKQGIIRTLKNSQCPVDNYLFSIIQAVWSQHAQALNFGSIVDSLVKPCSSEVRDIKGALY